MTRYILFWSALCFGALGSVSSGCNGNESTSGSSQPVLNASGAWDCQFVGTVVERSDGGPVGGSQTDDLTLGLQQSGSTLAGEAIFAEGRSDELRLPLTGTVEGSNLNYRAELTIAGCRLTLEATAALNSTASEFSGNQTQSTCEGRAVGSVSCRKR